MSHRSRILSTTSSTTSHRSDIAASRAKAMFRSRSRSPSPLQLHRRTSPGASMLLKDNNIASLFPGIEASESFERMTAEADRRKKNQTVAAGAAATAAVSASTALSSSRLPPENRFLPQLEPSNTSHSTGSSRSPATITAAYDEELPPEDGALQFVPAFETAFDDQSTSWDVILENKLQQADFDEEKKTEQQQLMLPATRRNSAYKRTRPRNFHPNAAAAATTMQQQQQQQHDDDDDNILEDSWTAVSNSKKGSGRIARFASIFSSRAIVRSDQRRACSPLGQPRHSQQQQQHSRQHQPSSPAHSGSTSTSGYVGWPGTQDKRGATVAIQSSSYEDSSAGAPAVTTSEQHYSKSDAVEREVTTRWTGDTRQGLSHSNSNKNNNVAEAHAHPSATTAPATSNVVQRELAAPNRLGTRRYNPHNNNNNNNAPNNANTSVADRWKANNKITVADISKNVLPSPPISATTSSASKTSSAYFNVEEMARLGYPNMNEKEEYSPNVWEEEEDDEDPANGRPPTEETLAANDKLKPPHRVFSAAKGYRGLIEKTQEVPCLMDAMDSDSMSSSKATSTFSSLNGTRRCGASSNESDVFDGLSLSKESDVFDNISNVDTTPSRSRSGKTAKVTYPERIAEEEEGAGNNTSQEGDFSVVLLANGLTAIQSTDMGFSNRRTASDFDENLTNSEVDQQGFARVPGFHEMINAGKARDSSLHGIHGNLGATPRVQIERNVVSPGEDLTVSDESSSLFTDPYDHDIDGSHLDVAGDLSEYYVHPKTMKKLVRQYRMLSDNIDQGISLAEYEREEDEHKAFALFEMRSRIMEKDIERGLERRGGTVVVDDIVTTSFNRTAHRIRDAVIVAKAWRDGASPMDVVNTALLTRRAERSYFIKRPLPVAANDSMSSYGSRRYTWEAVRWIDDTDFMQYRCPSLGPRHMLGFEMFTVGDCQSILLKLTNEHCMNLRKELNDATRRQIEAEDLLRHETDTSFSMMTDAEMTYLSAMEEVKTISKKLVAAEKSFTLVRDRIEELVFRYQELLVKIENESSFAEGSSVVTYESSYFTEHDSEYWKEHEREVWARRAKRAEIRAELAAREAQMAKHQARMIQEEKQRELELLKKKLFELQSESSTAVENRERSAAIAQNYAPDRNSDGVQRSGGIDKQKVDGVKQRFRERVAARKAATNTQQPYESRSPYHPTPAHVSPHHSPTQQARDLFRSAGEEMYQHLDFYERSLRAVQNSREDRY